MAKKITAATQGLDYVKCVSQQAEVLEGARAMRVL